MTRRRIPDINTERRLRPIGVLQQGVVAELLEEPFSTDRELAKAISTPLDETQRILNGLIKRGYVRVQGASFTLTDEGYAFAKSQT